MIFYILLGLETNFMEHPYHLVVNEIASRNERFVNWLIDSIILVIFRWPALLIVWQVYPQLSARPRVLTVEWWWYGKGLKRCG
jgi:hypothetical protein